MKLFWKKASHSCVPLGIIYTAISLMLIVGAAFAHKGMIGPLHCVFKAIVGIPCPTCGITKSMVAISHLDITGALRWNPLVFISLLIIWAWGLLSIFGMATGRGAPIIEAHGKVATALRIVFFTALIANWVYLIQAGV